MTDEEKEVQRGRMIHWGNIAERMNMNSITFDFPVHILSTVVKRKQGRGKEAGLHDGPLLKTFWSKFSIVCMYVHLFFL